MGFRFRKRIRIAKGLYLNLGRRSGSLSIGRRGATMNISEKGVHETVGLPGTGISYRTHRAKIMATRGPVKAPRHSVEPARFLAFIAVAVIVLWILAHLH
jgi:hypothetical protein